MKLNMYAIQDVQAEVFMRPMYFNTSGMAEREFLRALLNEQNISSFPADYVLYLVGQWDDETGLLEGNVPVRICTGTELLLKRQDDVDRLKKLHEEIAEIQEG